MSRRAIEIQVNEYGQTPKQLFNKKHPKKFSSESTELNSSAIIGDGLFDKKDNFSYSDKKSRKATSDNNLNYSEPNDKANSLQNNTEIDIDKLDIQGKEITYNFDRTYTCIPKFLKK